jgi:acyl-CoA thioesterase-1
MLFRGFHTILFLLASTMMPAFAEPAPIILIFGDSLSAGYGLERDHSWPHLLTDRLQSNGFHHQVVNASISGETTAGGLSRLPQALAQHKPDYLVLALGANDGLRGFAPSTIHDNLRTMIKLALDADISVLLVGIKIPSNYGPAYTQAFYEQFTRLAKTYPVDFLPFLLDGIALDQEFFQQDGIHPTSEAQPIILENVWKQLQPMLVQTGV